MRLPLICSTIQFHFCIIMLSFCLYAINDESIRAVLPYTHDTTINELIN